MYRTDRMGVAAFIIARGYKMQGAEPINDPRRPQTMAFVFGEVSQDEGDTMFRQFYAGGLAEARTFEQGLIEVKIALNRARGTPYSRPPIITPNYFPGGAR